MPDTPANDAHHQHQHTRAPVDLAAAARAGAFSYAESGPAKADAFDAAMVADPAAFDAGLLERDGPDALTSDRAYRMAQFRRQQAAERIRAVEAAEAAEGDHDLVGSILGMFRRRRGWSRGRRTDWLGIAPEDYARLAILRRPAAGLRDLTYDRAAIEALADLVGAHATRLYGAFDWGDP
jgi:hypothetical protein